MVSFGIAAVSRMGRRFGVARLIAVAILAFMVLLRVADPGPIEELRARALDGLQLLNPRVRLESPVVIVDIDEQSLRRVGQWPWPRTQVATLIDRLAAAGAIVVGFDVIFAEADRLSPSYIADELQGLDEATRATLRTLPSNDEIMAAAMKRTKVVLGHAALPNPAPTGDTSATASLALLGSDPAPFLIRFPGLLRNTEVLDRNAAGRGIVSVSTERDGIVRRAPLVISAQGAVTPSLTLEMLRVATDSSTILVKADPAGVKSLGVASVEIPTDGSGQVWIYFSPHDRGRYVSAVDVLEGRVGPDRIAQHLVLVGTSAAGLLDLKTTPVERTMPGVEIHAQILENIFAQSMLERPRHALVIELFATLVLGLLLVCVGSMLAPLQLLAAGALVIALVCGAVWFSFARYGLLLDATSPLLTTAAVYLVFVFSNYMREQSQRRRIRTAFGQYLAPAMVEQLVRSPEKLVLGGEQREMTVMFSDVRGFTAIAEMYKDDPQGLTALMNRFLTPLTNAIIERNGTIDKYMGDAIMAFWNAPLEDATHELNACEAALDMLDRVEELNRLRKQEAAPPSAYFPIDIGVGINTGLCVVGNMGSDLRFDYSVLGDSVNLASRLEGQCKSYGLPIILGSRTAIAARSRFAVFELDFIAVKGKKEPELAYTILGRQDFATSRRFEDLRAANLEMLDRYRARDWQSALGLIEKCRSMDAPGRLGRLYEIYVERIKLFQSNPPPDSWNGAFALETK